jgi:hypothetical protein
MTDNTDDIKQRISEIVSSYERMLTEVLIKKGERFDSAPFTLAIQALNKILDNDKEKQ